MSIEHLSWAFDLEGLSSSEKLTLLALCDRADQNGKCWPAYTDILRRTGLNRKTLASTIRSLEDKGLIEKGKRHGRSTVYSILSSTDIGTGCGEGRPKNGTGGRPKNGTRVGPILGHKPYNNHQIEPKGKKFVPPSVSEVHEYCMERGNKVDAETFVDFYSMKGWKVGNTGMKDWKAAVRTWEKRSNTQPNQQSQSKGDWF